MPFPLDTPQLTLSYVVQSSGCRRTVAHSSLMDLHFSLEPRKGVGEVFDWDCVQNITSETLHSHLGPLGLIVYASINKQITVIFPREGYLKGGFWDTEEDSEVKL